MIENNSAIFVNRKHSFNHNSYSSFFGILAKNFFVHFDKSDKLKIFLLSKEINIEVSKNFLESLLYYKDLN